MPDPVSQFEYIVMVSRDKVYVELFNRQDADWRGYEAHESLDATIKLPAIDFKIALADIYPSIGRSSKLSLLLPDLVHGSKVSNPCN